MLGIGAPNLVHAQIKALFGHLRGHHDGATGINPVKNRLLIGKSGVGAVLGNASHAKGLQDNRVVILG